MLVRIVQNDRKDRKMSFLSQNPVNVCNPEERKNDDDDDDDDDNVDELCSWYG